MLRTLPTESIDLIYIDPPFFSGEEYNVIWGDANEVRTFSDIWDGGLDTYLIWLNARLWEMRRVLKSTGSIYVHCDWHASHYIKAEMDKIFGYENFRNEIVWQRKTGRVDAAKTMGRQTDTILLYTKSDKFTLIPQFGESKQEYVEQFYRYVDEKGRRYRLADLSNPAPRPNLMYEYKGYKPPKNGWAISRERMEQFDREGRLHFPKDPNGRIQRKRFLDELKGQPIQNLWTDISPVAPQSYEKIGYPTQKPEALIERILNASSRPRELFADFFCGGGGSLVAAQRLRRRWIGCDISRVAISVTLDRLVKICEEQSGVESNYGKVGQAGFQLGLPEVKEKVPDIRVVYVGVYPMDRFKSVDQADFERFILQCFDASQDTSDEPISGWRTQLEPVLVGPADPDEILEPRKVKAFFEACLRHLQPNTRMKARVLAWKFSPQLNAYRKQLLEYIAKNLVSKGVAMELDYVPINSQEFRERIVRKYPDASDNEFFLRFTQPPIIGEIVYKKIGSRKYRFEAVDTYSTNLDGYLVNCQWDFDYQRGHFGAHPEYVLGRRELKGNEAKQKGRKFEAVLVGEHEFEKPGQYTVACRVQDNLGGEAIKSIEITVDS
ncbi:MAG: DNA methyltransferase [Acidobacteriota bacterium]